MLAAIQRSFPSSGRRLAARFMIRGRMMTTESTTDDLNKIMTMLGHGTQAPQMGAAADYLTTRQVVFEYLSKAFNPETEKKS
jgi:hypothetical protein